MTTPKEALERARDYLRPKAKYKDGANYFMENEESRLLGIVDEALASLQGEDAVERVAQAAQAFWQSPSGRSWIECCEKLPQQAEWFRRLARAILAKGLVPDEVRAEPTEAQINSACLSYRHDYGLLPPDLRAQTRFKALEWLRAWQKEGFGCDRDEVIERCAAVVDQCNREGPYEAIASAKRIRALKSAAIRSGGGE